MDSPVSWLDTPIDAAAAPPIDAAAAPPIVAAAAPPVVSPIQPDPEPPIVPPIQSGAEPPIDTSIEERNRKGTNKMRLRLPTVHAPPAPVAGAVAAIVQAQPIVAPPSAPLLHSEKGFRKGAIGAADYPVGGPDDLADVLQPPQSQRPDRRAETERRIKEAEAFRDQLRKQVDDLGKHKRDGLEAILAGREPPTFVGGVPAEKPRESLVQESQRKEAEKTAIGQDRL